VFLIRYNPPGGTSRDVNVSSEDEETDEPVYWEGRPRYVSDQTAFMRWSTEMEQTSELIDKRFLQDNRHRIIDINKILPLSFIESAKSLKLFRLRRINMSFARDAGLIDLADETVLDNLADYQTTRGIRGNYQKVLITQRREWQDKTGDKSKRGMFGRLIAGKREEERETLASEE